MAKITQQTLDMIKSEASVIAEPLGISVEKAEYVREDGLWYLRVTVNRPEGISLSDCEALHRPLSKRLDEIDPIPGTYYLEVCSPGQ